VSTAPDSNAAEPALQETSAGGPNWNDPNIPPGNAPPMPRGRLIAAAIVFGLWVCFLIAMAWLRVQTTPR
jgi:hypothetical protein